MFIQIVDTLRNVIGLFVPVPALTGNTKTVNGKEVPEVKWVFTVAIGQGKYGMPLGWVMILTALAVKLI